MDAKTFYKRYQADNGIVIFNKRLAEEILKFKPNHVFEFGCGTGKNLTLLQKHRTEMPVSGMDISMINVINSYVKNDIKSVMIGDESYLRHLCNYDIVFTCSVLDHIENIDGIIAEFKRICNTAIVIAECIDHDPSNLYWMHDYESMGFQLITNSEYYSGDDGRIYKMWQWIKSQNVQN